MKIFRVSYENVLDCVLESYRHRQKDFNPLQKISQFDENFSIHRVTANY